MSPIPKEVFVVAAVIRDGDRTLAAKRLPGGPAGGRWEFPGGKVEPQELPAAALKREIREELGIEVEVGPVLGEFSNDQGYKAIRLLCFWSRVRCGEFVLNAHSELRWCSVAQLRELDWAEPDIPAVELVVEEMTATARLTT